MFRQQLSFFLEINSMPLVPGWLFADLPSSWRIEIWLLDSISFYFNQTHLLFFYWVVQVVEFYLCRMRVVKRGYRSPNFLRPDFTGFGSLR
jgi:hypothetical protein